MDNKRKARTGALAWRRRGFVLSFLTPTLVVFCVFYLYPLINVAYTSFCQWDYTNVANPQFWGWDELWNNFDYIFNIYPYFWEAFGNSFLWAMLGVLVQIPIATFMALAFSRKMRGVKTIRNIYIIPSMLSSAAVGMIFLQLYSPLYGVVNPVIQVFNPGFTENILLLEGPAFWALTCAYIFFTGTTTLIILGNIMAVPNEIRDAALLDGASGFKQDLRITLPMIKGTLRTVSVIAASSGFIIYNEIYFLTKGAAGTYSLSYIIRELAINSQRTQFGRANAVALIQIVMGMVVILVVNILFALPDIIHDRRVRKLI